MYNLIDNILVQIKNFSDNEIKNYSLLSLAFLGDAIYSLYVREKLIVEGNFKVKDLHSKATKFVKAKAQCYSLNQIEPILTEEENQIVKTAKNAKTNNIAKNASIKEYKSATAFESLLGYLALKKNYERLDKILNCSFNAIINSFD